MSSVHCVPFGCLPDGQAVQLCTLRSNTLEVGVLTYGGRIAILRTPDRHGNPGDIVLGFDSLEGYVTDNAYLGAVIGRFANRIARGRFALDGRIFQVSLNDGPNSLHGGLAGFDQRVWSIESCDQSLVLRYLSENGEEGYPGTLDASVCYRVKDNELRIDYRATTTLPTIINLTNHSYFNLTAEHDHNILGHSLVLHADCFTPITADLIPTGSLRRVDNCSPFDFRRARLIGECIEQDDEQLRHGAGYDHNWVLRSTGPELKLAAEVHEPVSGRRMQIHTTEPGMQFYSGNQLDGSARGKGLLPLGYRCGFSLETQHFPDSPNHADFPAVSLYPAAAYHSTTLLRFLA